VSIVFVQFSNSTLMYREATMAINNVFHAFLCNKHSITLTMHYMVVKKSSGKCLDLRMVRLGCCIAR
jgi:hypothetical protein